MRFRCPLTPGVPVKAMLAHPSKGIPEVMKRFENQTVTCEYKYDGERAQVHLLSDGSVKIFSRNSEDSTGKFPDIVKLMPATRQAKTLDAVIDCEVVAYDAAQARILPFQALAKRARKNVKADAVSVAVCLFAFDLLFLNGRSLLDETLAERRRQLMSAFQEVEGAFKFVTHINTAEAGEIEDFLETAVLDNCEGLMIKSLVTAASTYIPDKRSREWLKVKKDYIEGMTDSFDLVVVGAWQGRGKRTGGLGAFLLASYNRDSGEFETVCKLGTGFSDEQLESFTRLLMPHKMSQMHPSARVRESPNQPDVWFEPKVVWEVAAADLSISPQHTAAMGKAAPDRGIALRFPRFLRLRDDKAAEGATSSEQVGSPLYSSAPAHRVSPEILAQSVGTRQRNDRAKGGRH